MVTLYIINKNNYHWEILESLIKNAANILYSDISSFDNFVIDCPNDTIFKSYITTKYKNVSIVQNQKITPDDYVIYATMYENNQYIKYYSPNKNYRYIFHSFNHNTAKRENCWAITPLFKMYGSSNFFIPYHLPEITKIKPKIPIFIVQGNIVSSRRNFILLEHIFKNTQHLTYKIKLLGRGNIPRNLIKYKNKIIHKKSLDFINFHNEFSDVYYILPLIDKQKYPSYFKNKLTSSVSYAFGYNIPVFCVKELNDIYQFPSVELYTNDNIIEKFTNLVNNYTS